MKPETFVRQLVVDGVYDILDSLHKGKGYNTQPFVTKDPREIQGREEDFMLLVMPAEEPASDTGMGGCHKMDLTVDVYGYAQTKDGNPVTRLNLLLQDVRNAICGNVGNLSTAAGTGLAFRLGDLETDNGIMAQDGQAAFVQSTHFVYKNGATW